MPAATEDVGDEVNGYLNVRYKGGKKFRWKRKYAVLKQNAIYLSDEKESIPDDTSELRLPGVFNSCGAYTDKKTRKKHGFVLEPIDAEHQEQWYFTCDDSEQQQKWMNAINDVISGKKVQKAVSCPEFDEIIVQSTTLQHLAKDRPKFHGRRLPAKRPRSENALNGIPENADAKSETPDSSQPNSPARDLNGASTSAPASPANAGTKHSPAVKRRDKKKTAFLRGIGARVSRIFGTQPPRSPTSPGRLGAESPPPRVPDVTVTDGKTITKVEEEEEDVPDVVTKEDIIKMLDFVSETTELVVYKALAIRGTISSVDETKANQELRNASRSMRKAVNSLKGTMDSLTQAEEALKNAPEIKPDVPHDEGTATTTTITATAPIAVDEEAVADDSTEDQTGPSAEDHKDTKNEESGKQEETDKLREFTDSLDTVEDFEERKPSVSLMDEIQKTLNGEHSISADKDSAPKDGEANKPASVETNEQTPEESKEAKAKEDGEELDEHTESSDKKAEDEKDTEKVKVKEEEVKSAENTSEKEQMKDDDKNNSNKADADIETEN